MTTPTPAQIRAISDYLHAIDRCMTDEGINGHTRRRVLNRFCWGHPAGDPDVQIAVMVDKPTTDQPTWHEFYNRYIWPAGQETAGMPPGVDAEATNTVPGTPDPNPGVTDEYDRDVIGDRTTPWERAIEPAWGQGRGAYLSGLLGEKFAEDKRTLAASTPDLQDMTPGDVTFRDQQCGDTP